MRSRFASLVCAAIAAFPFVLGACRDKDPPPEPVATSTAQVSAALPPRCPPQPEWAPLPGDDDHLLAEILFQPSEAAGRKGTGMRIFDTGMAVAYDEVLISFANGKMQADPIPGAWRPKGPVTGKRLEELRKTIDERAVADLSEWQGSERRGTKKPSFLRVRRTGGELVRGCWRGNEGSSAQQRLEELIKTIIGEAGDAAAAAASASAKPRGKAP